MIKNQLLLSLSVIFLGVAMSIHMISGAHLNDFIAASIKDSGCTTSQQKPAPSKTRADTYNYAMLRGE